MKGSLILIALASAALSQAQVIGGQIDRFLTDQQGWLGATPQWVSTGGAGDNGGYLSLTSTGGTGAQSKMAGRNTAQWSGNYTAANVGSISVSFKNFSNVSLEMRLVLFSQNGSQWVSSASTVLAAGSGWTTATYSLADAGMVRVSGTATYADTLLNAQQLMFRHDPGAPSSGGVSVAANLGIDNVTANVVPEPASMIALSAGALALLRRRRGR